MTDQTHPVKVSVMLPIYNVEKYLPSTLDAIAGQTYPNIEVILVDDGSTDSSGLIADEYAEKEDRISVIHQENAGPGAARNAAMERATGDYFVFLDPDDCFEPDLVEKAIAACLDTDADVCVYQFDIFWDGQEGERISTSSAVKEEHFPGAQPFSPGDIEGLFLSKFPSSVWDKMFKADLIRRNGLKFEDFRVTEDLGFNYMALILAERITILPKILVHYRMGRSGSANAQKKKQIEVHNTAMRNFKLALHDAGVYAQYERDFANLYARSIRHFLFSSQGQIDEEMYENFRNVWLDEYGLTGKEREYFCDEQTYDLIQKILRVSAAAYLNDTVSEYCCSVERLNAHCIHVTREYENAVAVVQRLEKAYNDLKAECDDLKAERGNLKAECDRIQGDLDRIQQSKTYQLAAALGKPLRALRSR